ncbi:MAG TPA: serine hydrolase [Ramlibacter sp.]|nr:serine hydrolase [Ramlibacter sp.]
MTHPHGGRTRLRLGWWIALLSLMLAFAPLEGFARSAPAKKVTVSAKSKAKAKSKSRASAKKRGPARGKTKASARGAKKKVVSAKSKKKVVSRSRKAKSRTVVARKRQPPPLPASPDKLPLAASVAYVIDAESNEVLLSKNDDDVRPIASLTKLMTALVISDAQLPMDETIVIDDADVDRLKFSSSRLRVGTELTRRQALHLALMSSENRAAHALARTYPGGVTAFVSAMNIKARQLGMDHTQYVDPTGLSSDNQSSARDLAILGAAAYERPLLRKYSTSPGYQLAVDGKRPLRYVNSNRLVRAGQWDIGLQKTGYINEAGQCLLMQAKVDGRNVIMVFLDSASKITRVKDAEIVKRWIRAYAGEDDNG